MHESRLGSCHRAEKLEDSISGDQIGFIDSCFFPNMTERKLRTLTAT
jgi:hypothetical protein